VQRLERCDRKKQAALHVRAAGACGAAAGGFDLERVERLIQREDCVDVAAQQHTMRCAWVLFPNDRERGHGSRGIGGRPLAQPRRAGLAGHEFYRCAELPEPANKHVSAVVEPAARPGAGGHRDQRSELRNEF
jgi:hypothetical protein